MDAETQQVLTELAAAIRGMADAHDRNERLAAELQAQVDLLVEIFVSRGDLDLEHKALLERVRQKARLIASPSIALGDTLDKYVVESPAIDCAARLHLCHGRCCALKITLTRQDVREGHLTWDLDRPYVMTKAEDGYCTYLSSERGCTVYEHRPATCRSYSCVDDQRVWIDFAKRIPAPMPLGLVTIRRRPG